VPFVQLLTSPDYDLSVDARIVDQGSFTIAEVLIQNKGTQLLTNIKVDFGGGDTLDMGTLKAYHKVILTPPTDNKLEFVTVSADQGIFETTVYEKEN